MADRSAHPALLLTVDRASEVPLATQLAWKLRTLIATGQLEPGARLPGVREVAESAGVNVNTVRGVYGRLEEEALVSSQHGRGTFVSQEARSQAELGAITAEVVARASAAGVDLRDVATALFVDGGPDSGAPLGELPAAEPLAGSGRPEPDERAQRRELRLQIAHVERELAYAEGLTGEPLASPSAAPGGILSTAELEALRDRLLERLAARRDDLEDIRRDIMAARYAPQPASEGSPSQARTWRHGGVSTGRRAPGAARVVWTRSGS